MSDFPGKIVEISPPPFFLVVKKLFFEFSEKTSNFFSMKLTFNCFYHYLKKTHPSGKKIEVTGC